MTILKFLSSEDEALLVGRDALLALGLGLDIADSVCGFDFKADGLTRQSLDKDLHSTAEMSGIWSTLMVRRETYSSLEVRPFSSHAGLGGGPPGPIKGVECCSCWASGGRTGRAMGMVDAPGHIGIRIITTTSESGISAEVRW